MKRKYYSGGAVNTGDPEKKKPTKKKPTTYKVKGVTVSGSESDSMLRDLRPNYESKKVKSRVPRYREHATGGQLPYQPLGSPGNPAEIRKEKRMQQENWFDGFGQFMTQVGLPLAASVAAPGLGNVASGVTSNITPNVAPNINAPTPGTEDLITMVYEAASNPDRTMEAAMGGALNNTQPYQDDLGLSDSSFQVKYSGDKKDDKIYAGGKIALDKDEVIKNDFAFSNRIVNPQTGRRFSEDAAEIERSTGRSEKKASKHSDQIAKNTIKMNEKASSELAALQEILAEQMGLRNNTTQMSNGGRMQYAAGGNTDPIQLLLDQLGQISPEERQLVAQDLASMVNRQETYPNTYMASPVDQKPGPRPSLLNSVNGPDISRDLMTMLGHETPPGTPMFERTLPEVVIKDTPLGNDKSYSPREGRFKKFTPGDIMQLFELSSKFAGLGGPEVERPYYDTTRVSQEVYDPTDALFQSNRNYRNARNNISSSSLNTRRAIENSMYANKMGADNQTIANYNSMNQRSKTAYEQRLSNQSRYNNQQSVLTNDLNARNRAAHDFAVQNAFESFGNFGEALNNRKTQYDRLDILAEIFPDVYSRVAGSVTT